MDRAVVSRRLHFRSRVTVTSLHNRLQNRSRIMVYVVSRTNNRIKFLLRITIRLIGNRRHKTMASTNLFMLGFACT